jgi:hypothetical protein
MRHGGWTVPLEFKIFPSRANSVMIALKKNGKVIDHTAITRCGIYVGSTLFDSQTEPMLFDLTNTTHVEIKLGQASPALAVGKYPCKLVIYDVGKYASGFIVPINFVVSVLDEDGV